jgi:nucleotide-binding universal stress UspA family protein
VRIVVGYVPGKRGVEAINLAATLAGSREATLDVVVVLPSDEPTFDMYSPDKAYQAALESQARGWLDKALARIPEGIEARGHLRRADSITAGLIEAATQGELGPEAEGIVVGAASSGPMGRLKIGSVAGSLLHSAPVPVALAPKGYRGHPAITRITCALGDRHGADALLEVAIAAAAARGVPLRLMSLLALDKHDESRDERIAAAEAHESSLVARAASQLSTGVTGVVGTGKSLGKCVKSLEFDDTEMVLIGSGRLAGPRQVFLSASANRISRALPVPMVVVPRDYEPPVG